MIVTITDDFDLDIIIASGQCFRAKEISEGLFRFISGKDVLYIRRLDTHTYDLNCDQQLWNRVWVPFFSLDINYRNIRKEAEGKNHFIDRAIGEGVGLRVLRQDPWEMLISFIISQRKSIPAITKAVNKLAENFGSFIITEHEQLYAFPTAQQLMVASYEELNNCSLGYRTPYVIDAVKKVVSGEIQLEALKTLNDECLCQQLMQIRGVGKKVANCVCLFGYGRTGAVPVDVWIRRAIDNECSGQNPFERYGSAAGIMQQYVFYYEKSHQH